MGKDTIYRQDAIDTLNVGTELLRRVLDDADLVGVEREKYEWGLGLIESYISDMKDLPSAQPFNKGLWVKQEIAPQTLRFCSLCGCKKPRGVVGNFCPNCGADMRGEEDE